jgi:hypothetical protein
MFPQNKPEEKPKIEFRKLKYCVAKKDIGEETQECKEFFKKIGLEE